MKAKMILSEAPEATVITHSDTTHVQTWQLRNDEAVISKRTREKKPNY